MAVRLRLRIEKGNKTLDVVALVNSGYEADTPQLMVPITIAREWSYGPRPRFT